MAYHIPMARPATAAHMVALPLFSLIAILAVVLRFYARRIQGLTLSLNDHLILCGLLTNLALVGLTLAGTILVEESWYLMARCCAVVGPILWGLSVFFVRASILDLYLKLFPTRWFRRSCWVVHLINALFTVAIVASQLAICAPLSKVWALNPMLPGHCGNVKALELATASFNIVLDLLVIVLPMPVLWNLQLPTHKKVALSAMFSMGLAIVVINIGRIYSGSGITPLNHERQGYYICLLVSLEGLLGIVSACLPVLKPVFNEVRATKTWLRVSKTGVDAVSATIPFIMRRSQMGSAVAQSDDEDKTMVGQSAESWDARYESRDGEKKIGTTTRVTALGVRHDDSSGSSQHSV